MQDSKSQLVTIRKKKLLYVSERFKGGLNTQTNSKNADTTCKFQYLHRNY